jgi:RNA polymerase primary sigma factor
LLRDRSIFVPVGHGTRRREGNTMAFGAPLPVRSCERSDAIVETIHELLQDLRGGHSIKRLFWELLGYDHCDETILFPRSVAFRSSIIEAKLFASHETFHLYRVTLLGTPPDRQLVRKVCRFLRTRHRDFAVLASDMTQVRWQLAYLADEPGRKPARTRLATMTLGDPDENLRRQARLLSRLRAYDSDDEPLGILEVASAFDGVFARIHTAKTAYSKVFEDLHYLVRVLDHYPVLSRRRQQAIIAELADLRMTTGGGGILEDARYYRHFRLKEELVLHNLRLCFMFAKRYANGYQDIPDLFQEAVIGLQIAAEKVDPAYNTSFTTYASYWIKNRIRRAKAGMVRTIRLPAYLVQLKREWLRKSASGNRLAGQTPSVEEIAATMRLKLRTAEILRHAIHLESLTPLEDTSESGSLVIEQIIDERGLGQGNTSYEADLQGLVRERVTCLNLRESLVLRLRFGLDGLGGKTLREVGKTMGLTRERVRQIEQQALKNLRGLPEFAALAED